MASGNLQKVVNKNNNNNNNNNTKQTNERDLYG